MADKIEDYLLTPEEITVAEIEANVGFTGSGTVELRQAQYQAIAKAQLAKDQKHEQARMERLKREIESLFSATNYHSPEAGKGLVNSIDIEDWQNFWKREGVK